jgi:hypothetical protein
MDACRLFMAALLVLAGSTTLQAATVEIARSITKPSASEAGLATGEFVVSRGVGDPVGSVLTVGWEVITVAPAVSVGDYALSSAGAPLPSTSGTVDILAGASSAIITVTPLTDTTLEGAQLLTIQLLSGAGYSVGSNQSSSMTIADDDVSVSIQVPIPRAYEDYTPGAGTTLDPNLNRRGVFRSVLTPAPGFSTYVTTAVNTGAVAGQATLTTDYAVTYKIGGSAMGSGLGYTVVPRYAYQAGVTQIVVANGSSRIFPGSTFTLAGDPQAYTTSAGLNATSGTLTFSPPLTQPSANQTALTVTPPAVPTGFAVNDATPPAAGATQIDVDGGTDVILAGALLTFGNHATVYSTAAGLAGTSGLLTISPALTQAALDNDPITITYPAATGFTVNQANSEPVGTTTLALTGGTGGFSVGDVFRIDPQTTPQYRVTGWTGGTGATGDLSFTVFTGTAAGNGGIPTAITGTPLILTHFAASFSGAGNEVRVLVPSTATRIEYGITPVSDTTVEASETLVMSLLTSADYQVASPSSGTMTITDDDVVVAFDPSQSRNAIEGGTDGSFRLNLTAGFPRTVNIPYQIGGTADNSGDATTGDIDPLTGVVVLPPNTTTVTIPVHARPDNDTNAETLTLTLIESDDYRLATTPGATVNSSATISINDPQGTVSIAAGPATTTAEHPSAPVAAAFTVSIVRSAGSTAAITVPYSVTGTATAGTDYQTLTGSVTIGAGATSAVINVTPIDDTTPESSETVALALTAGQDYLIDAAADDASVTITDDEPVVGVLKTSDAIEGGTNGVFTVGYAPPALPRAITVDLTYSGTAVAGDYTATTADASPPTAVVIPANSFSATVTIAAVNDTTPEGDETVIATVTAKPAVYTVAVPAATMTIDDDEPVLKIAKVADAVEDGAAGSFRVFYDGATVGREIDVTLTYPTTSATATAADFTTALPTTVKIPATGTEVVVTVTAKYDGLAEGTETLDCTIGANAAVYTIATPTATLSIADRLPTLTLTGGGTVTEGGTYQFTIASSFKPLVPFTVGYTVTGTATPGAAAGGTLDYKTLSGSLSISELTTKLDVVTFADAAFDPFETVIITLTEPVPPSFLKAGTAALSASVQILDAARQVVEVTSTAADGTHGAGAVLPIAVTFSQPIQVSGSPTLTLETGLNDTQATYVGLSPDSYSALFSYTVRATDLSANLDYAGTTALSLGGGSITNALAEAMDPTLPAPGADGSLGEGRSRVIDGGTPSGKPSPGSVGSGGGGGCGLGSGFAAFALLCMLAGFALSVRRGRG